MYLVPFLVVFWLQSIKNSWCLSSVWQMQLPKIDECQTIERWLYVRLYIYVMDV